MPDADWLFADACELAALEEAGVQTCDVVIAATGDDKANLAVGLLAKTEFGVPRVVARINDIRNEWLFTQAWGVDVAVSTPGAMVAGDRGRHRHRPPRAIDGTARRPGEPGETDAARRQSAGRSAVRDLPLPENTALVDRDS